MKVFIVTEGGKNIGLGHITRCTSVYQAFEEIGIQAQFIVNGDKIVQGLLKDKSCEIFDWLNDSETLAASIRDADIVFVDSYLADYDVYEKISNIVKTAVYFDDNVRFDYPKGFVLNGAVFAEQMPYPKREGVTYLLGVQYAPLRREFWDVPAKPIRDNIETVMVTFGGADIRNLTPKVLKLLADTRPELFKKVIIGSGFQNIAEIEKAKDSNTELIYQPNAAEIKKVMFESDVAISAGGQTLYELARVGVPTIAVAVADNQSNNISGWVKTCFVEYAGHWDDDRLAEEIEQKIKILESKRTRKCKQEIGNKLIDGQGSSRVVKELLSNFYKEHIFLRKATFNDALDIFNLANETIVRENSFSSNKIEWDEHIEWFKNKLESNTCEIFIIECLGEFAGQVRFDINSEQNEAVISISIVEKMRGLGLSSFVITNSLRELPKFRRDVKLIKAYIKDENIASVKSFMRAGFRFLQNTRVNGCKSKVYERATEDLYE